MNTDHASRCFYFANSNKSHLYGGILSVDEFKNEQLLYYIIYTLSYDKFTGYLQKKPLMNKLLPLENVVLLIPKSLRSVGFLVELSQIGWLKKAFLKKSQKATKNELIKKTLVE